MMIRMSRREVLTRRNAPQYTSVLGEAVLRQGIGGPEVRAEQLRHLLVTAARKNFSALCRLRLREPALNHLRGALPQ
jgi:hypothetical protein